VYVSAFATKGSDKSALNAIAASFIPFPSMRLLSRQFPLSVFKLPVHRRFDITPSTYRRVSAEGPAIARCVERVFGWPELAETGVTGPAHPIAAPNCNAVADIAR
jgi:hypothetical protein